MAPRFDELLQYTEWERERWRAVFRANGDALGIETGPNGDGRLATVRDVIKHVFSAETRYVERLTNAPLTDPATIATEDVEALFAFGERTRGTLRRFVEDLPAER